MMREIRTQMMTKSGTTRKIVKNNSKDNIEKGAKKDNKDLND
jgi:hypothetical protein